MNEMWKPVRGYEDLYEVSNCGHVKSLSRYVNNNGTKIMHKSRILKPSIRHGYLCVVLRKNDTSKSFSVHRLVAQAFISNPSHYPVINHKDENRQNNNASNLEWCTQRFNCNYGNHNTKISKSLNGRSIAQYSLNGKLLKIWSHIGDAERNGFDPSCVSKCCRHVRKTHKGYKWEYLNN